MPILTYKQPIDRFRGSVMDRSGSGLTIYDSAKAGNVARKYVIPFNPNTALQQSVRGNFTIAAQGFAALSSAQSEAWNTAAEAYKRANPLDVEYGFSGINLYMQVNAYRKLNNAALTATPPTDLTYPVLDAGACMLTAGVSDGGVIGVTLTAEISNPNVAAQMFLVLLTPVWTLDARLPRRSDYAMRNVAATADNVIEIPQGETANEAVPLTNAAKPAKSGDIVWASVLGLSTQYVPAPAPTIFKHTLTTT